ncbi:MAG: hypothetical protein EU542_08225 [Promethearchaeota archaeon]|nr:MAG: hypothetical protein EU542_08225 [Candidatus Lokiarchaeota archaeon]
MTEDSKSDDSNQEEYVTRIYNCPICRMMHTIKLPKDLPKNKPAFPFPYVFLHSSDDELDDLLTVLYIDLEMHIRAVEVMEIEEESNIFSEELTKQITEKLMDKIVSLEEENLQLKDFIQRMELVKVSGMEKKNPKIMSIPKVEYESEMPGKPVTLEPQLPKIKEINAKKPLFDLQEIPKNEINKKEPGPMEKTMKELINIFILSTVGPGEKQQDLTIDLNNKVASLKETVGNIFGLIPSNFHLSSGGITFDEQILLKDYNLEDGDEILIIPSSTAGEY